jgi:hypothetical protein
MLRRSPIQRKRPEPLKARDRSDEFASFVVDRQRAVLAQGLGERAPVVVEKDVPHYSEAWRRAVAGLPNCVRCMQPGGVQAAHRNQGKSMGKKTDDCLTAALCQECHAEIDHGKDMTREERRAALDGAIMRTLVLLFRAGKLRVA